MDDAAEKCTANAAVTRPVPIARRRQRSCFVSAPIREPTTKKTMPAAAIRCRPCHKKKKKKKKKNVAVG